MTSGLGLAALAIAAAIATFGLIIRELYIRELDARVSKAMIGAAGQPSPLAEVTGWLSSLGARYRRFYSAENLEELRAIVQSAGFNPYRTLPILIGGKTVSMFLFPIVALFLAMIFGEAPKDRLIFIAIGLAIGIILPRLILSALRRRFNAAIRRGAPDAIDLLVVCSEAGMGLESALERVAEEMTRSNRAMARVLSALLDDLRILSNRRDAFEKLAATSEGLRRFGTMINQSLQYGTPLSQALRAIAEELRREAIIKLEERAHKLGAQLLLPMAVFMLPAMFVVLGGSSYLHLMSAFSSQGGILR
jgi:tight adherence protein C